MRRLALSMAATLVLGGALSCRGATGGGGSFDGGAPSTPPLTCANDSTCGTTGRCVRNQCVAQQPDIGTWAIEIDPPRGSGSQLTELPAAGVVQPILMPSPEINLAVSFDNTGKPGVPIPTSAGVILSAPSTIPGRPARAFQAILASNGRAALAVPAVLSGGDVLFTLIPVSPADLMSPPYALPFMIPSDATAFAIPLPADPFTIRGQLRTSFDEPPKTQYSARVFERSIRVTSIPDRDVLVSSIGKTSADGMFSVILPGGARSDLTLELVPESVADPVVTLSGLSLTLGNTDLGVISLPSYAAPDPRQPFQVTVRGDDGTPVEAATVRAHTTFAGTASAAQVTTQFFRNTLTDAGGVANLSLIPGTTVQQPYTLSIVPPAGADWASQCVTAVPVGFNGPAAPAVTARAVTLTRRPKLSGTLLTDSGTPVAGALVTATSAAAIMPPCLPGPTTTGTTTDAMGRFELRLDPANYKLEFVPPAGSPYPRMTILTTPIQWNEDREVRLPEPAVVEGYVRNTAGAIPGTTIRIFQPRCDRVDPCTTPPVLHAETQTDADGRFRAVIPKPGTTGTN